MVLWSPPVMVMILWYKWRPIKFKANLRQPYFIFISVDMNLSVHNCHNCSFQKTNVLSDTLVLETLLNSNFGLILFNSSNLNSTSNWNPALSALLFEKSEVKSVCEILNPNTAANCLLYDSPNRSRIYWYISHDTFNILPYPTYLASSMRVPNAMPRYFGCTDNPTEPM